MAQLDRRSFLAGAATLAVAGAAGCSRVGATLASGRHPRPKPAPPEQVQERQQPGHRDWHLKGLGAPGDVEGFALPASVLPGQPFDLFLSSTSRTVDIEAFRMGWYAGVGARLVWHARDVRVADQAAKIDYVADTRTISADWEPTAQVPTTGWPEGSYLLRLTAKSGAQRYVPLVLRSTDSQGKILLVHATSTWQAYNAWGGYSLYHGPGGVADYNDRSYVVSFDRPYDGNGAVSFLDSERPVVELAEALGLALAWATSADVDALPELTADATAVISLGHDEYWSPAMREHVTHARDIGVNVAFLGANACFRRIRYQPSSLGSDREIVCYKTSYLLDPLYGVENSVVTSDWREPPDPDPESSLTGPLYEAYPTDAPYVIATADAWPYVNTGVSAGDSFDHLVGPEYDRVNPSSPLERPMTVLAHSPLTCKGVHSYSDSTYYTRSSGSGVLDVGTMHWVAALRNDPLFDRRTRRFVRRTTANILKTFAGAPAAVAHPAVDNVESFHPWPGDPTFDGHNLW
jgi:hypothetical protein